MSDANSEELQWYDVDASSQEDAARSEEESSPEQLTSNRVRSTSSCTTSTTSQSQQEQAPFTRHKLSVAIRSMIRTTQALEASLLDILSGRPSLTPTKLGAAESQSASTALDTQTHKSSASSARGACTTQRGRRRTTSSKRTASSRKTPEERFSKMRRLQQSELRFADLSPCTDQPDACLDQSTSTKTQVASSEETHCSSSTGTSKSADSTEAKQV